MPQEYDPVVGHIVSVNDHGGIICADIVYNHDFIVKPWAIDSITLGSCCASLCAGITTQIDLFLYIAISL
jgi:hypothetical protein